MGLAQVGNWPGLERYSPPFSADAPHAALRPRSGVPVSQVR
jgi:hypothetical protein